MTIENFATTVEQGKRLQEILPHRSADLSWHLIYDEDHLMNDYKLEMLPHYLMSYIGIPAWSLPALMGIFAAEYDSPVLEMSRGGMNLNGEYTKDWFVTYQPMYDEDEGFVAKGSTPFEAMTELICQLHEKGINFISDEYKEK